MEKIGVRSSATFIIPVMLIQFVFQIDVVVVAVAVVVADSSKI